MREEAGQLPEVSMTATAPFSLAKLLPALSLSSSSSSLPPSIQLQSRPDRRPVPSLLSEKLPHRASVEAADTSSILYPALRNASILSFKSGYYNAQIVAEDNEPEERLVRRFRREVAKAGVLQECRRRRFFETKQEAKKRKTREAAKRNRKRRPRAKNPRRAKEKTPKEKKRDGGDDGDDNWDLPGEDIPYCSKIR